MRILRKLIPIAVLAWACQTAFSQTFVIQQKPPALAHGHPPELLILDDGGKTVASIPLGWDQNDEQFAFSKSSHTLYKLNPPGKAKSEPRVLSAINPDTGQVARQITIGRGQEVALFVSKDGRRLYCYTYLGPSVSLKRASAPPFDPKISVIDTASNGVIGTYELSRVFFKGKNLKYTGQFLATGDGERLIALCSGFDLQDKLKAQQIEVFSGQASSPAFVIDPGGPVEKRLLTEDGKFLLIVVGKPKEHRSFLEAINLETGAIAKPDLTGNVRMMIPSEDSRSLFVAADKQDTTGLNIVDLPTGKVSERPLIDRPSCFVRLGQQHVLWVINSQEMRPISRAGELGATPILLNKPRKTEEGDQNAASILVDGIPAETISLGEDHAALLITSARGETSHRVALLDLNQARVYAIVRTMTTAEEKKIASIKMRNLFLERALEGAVAGVILAGEMHAQSGPVRTATVILPAIPLEGFANEMLAARSDGKFLYVLDTDSHEVTIVDVQAGTVLNRIPVDHAVAQVQLTADGKHLLCLGGMVQKIDLETNKLEN